MARWVLLLGRQWRLLLAATALVTLVLWPWRGGGSTSVESVTPALRREPDAGRTPGAGPISDAAALEAIRRVVADDALSLAVLKRELDALRQEQIATLDALAWRQREVGAAAVAEAGSAVAASLPRPPTATAIGAGGGPVTPYGLSACVSNAFLGSWDTGNFASAARALTDFRTSLISKGHGTHWAAGSWDRFFEPAVQPCSPMTQLGEGDGGKQVCALAALKEGCIVWSVGSDYNMDWERDVLATTPCEVYTFDCTVHPDDPRYVPAYGSLPARLHFQRVCLGVAGPGTPLEQRPLFRTFGQLTAELGHARVALVKFDIEGSEYDVVEDFLRGFLHDPHGPAAAALPDQMAFEQHYKTHTGLTW